MRTASMIVLILLLGFCEVASGAEAQGMRGRVRLEIGRTDVEIERAEALIRGGENEAARFELGEAIRVQGNAKRASDTGRPRIAVVLTLRARARAERAMELVRDLPDANRVSRQLARTRELLDRARALVDGCDDDRARTMVSTGLGLQRRAEQALHGGRQLAALQLTTMARDRASIAIRRCQSTGRAVRRRPRAGAPMR